jgi:hypothetical protein
MNAICKQWEKYKMRKGRFRGKIHKDHQRPNIIYDGVIIETNDISSVFKDYGGFIHSGSDSEFKTIFSDDNARRNIPAGKSGKVIDNRGVYFRAVNETSLSSGKGVIENVNAVGYSEPIYYFMPVEAVVGLEIIYAAPVREAVNNKQYSSITKPNSLMNTNLYKEILNLSRASYNRTEILFYDHVPFDKVTDIFIDEKSKSAEMINDILNEGVYEINGSLKKYLGAESHTIYWLTRIDGTSPIEFADDSSSD